MKYALWSIGALALQLNLLPAQQDSAESHRKEAQAQYRLGHIEATLEHLQQAIRLDPGNEQYYLDLGEVLSRNNAREAVVAVFEAAQKALPGSWELQTALGVAYLKVRNYEKAKDIFLSLLRLRPGDESALRLLAECYDITNDWENTATIAARLRDRNRNNSFGWYYGAKAEYEISKRKGEGLARALEYVRRAVELGPEEWQSHLLLGKVLMEARRDEEAVAALRRAIALNSENPQTYYVLARALRRLRRPRESSAALKAYNQAQASRSVKQRSLLVEIK